MADTTQRNVDLPGIIAQSQAGQGEATTDTSHYLTGISSVGVSSVVTNLSLKGPPYYCYDWAALP